MKNNSISGSISGDPSTSFQGTDMGKFLDDKTQPQQQKEGKIAKAIERQTTKLPSDTFLWLALGSIGVSATLQLMGHKQKSNFVGQWAPTFLILGLYNKIVKLLGSDNSTRN